MTDLAIDMHDVENYTHIGTKIELSNNVESYDFDIEDSYEPDLENFEITCDAGVKVYLCYSMHPCIK